MERPPALPAHLGARTGVRTPLFIVPLLPEAVAHPPSRAGSRGCVHSRPTLLFLGSGTQMGDRPAAPPDVCLFTAG